MKRIISIMALLTLCIVFVLPIVSAQESPIPSPTPTPDDVDDLTIVSGIVGAMFAAVVIGAFFLMYRKPEEN